jgi:hypothetical protein
MAFSIHHPYGACESNPALDRLEQLFDERLADDDEHPDVCVEHESAWNLAAFPSGLIVWENVEGEGPARHMRSVPRTKVIELWRKLAAGDIQAVDSEPWQRGYG